MTEVRYTPLAPVEQPAPSPSVPRLNQDEFLRRLDRKIALWTTLNIFISILTIFVLSSTMYHSHHSPARSTMTAATSANQTTTTNPLLDSQFFFPAFPTSAVVFSNDSYFQDEGARGDKLWADMLPEGGGALRVPNPRRFDMPPSALLDRGDSDASEAYAASVTHQLHCLVSRAFFACLESLVRILNDPFLGNGKGCGYLVDYRTREKVGCFRS